MTTRKLMVYCFASIVILVLASCSGMKPTATATPSSKTPIPAQAANTVSASGQVVPQKWVNLSFPSGGEDLQILVAVGQKVQAGQLLAHLDDTDAQTKLAEIKQSLSEMTSPETIANTKLAISNAEQDVTNAQTAYNNTQYWKNDALIQDYYAKMVTAKSNMDTAQERYASRNVGNIYSSDEASAYNALYDAQQAYANAKYNYDVYSQKPAKVLVDKAQANLELVNVRLTNAKNYLLALTGAEVPKDATGSAIEQLRQAQRNVVEAEKTLNATKLTSPFSGSIVEINGHNGELFSPGQPLIVLADFSTLEVQTKDMSEVDAGRVHVGDLANVSFDALPDANVTGKVTQIALKNSSGSGVYYTVTVALDKIPQDLRWGMSAFVVIKVK